MSTSRVAGGLARESAPARRRRELLPYVFLAPAVVTLLVITVYPISFGLVISLFHWELTARAPEFVGLANFGRAFTEPELVHSIKLTVAFTLISVTFSFLLGLLIALLLNRPFLGNRQARSLILLPMMMSPIVVGFIFQIMFHADYGVINYLLKDVFHLIDRKVVWLAEPYPALGTLIVTDVWLGIPFVALVLLAGLQSLDQEPLDAAKVDGASRWGTFRYVVWPLLKNPIMIAITIRTIVAARVFDIIYTLTEGGPAGFTEVLSVKAFQQGLQFFNVGYGSAMAILLVAVTLALVAFFFKLFDWMTG